MLNSVCIHLSDICNLECEHCWTNSSPKGIKSIGYKDVVKLIEKLKLLGLTRVSLSGGEPLMHPEIHNIIEYILHRGLIVVITTNGTLLTVIKRIFECIDKKYHQRLQLRISVDGPKSLSERFRGVDTFDKSISSIKWVKDNFGQVFVNSVVPVSIDFEEWKQFLLKLRSIKVDQLALISLSPRGRGKIRTKEFEKVHKNMLHIEEIARNEGTLDFVFNWDYLTVSNGYLLVENDGRIVLPGVYDNKDIVIGDIGNVNSNILANQIESYKKLLNYNSVS